MNLTTSSDQLRCLIEIQGLVSVTNSRIRTGVDFDNQPIRSCCHSREPNVHHMTT